MKSKFKKLLSLALALSLLFCLTACAGGTGGSSDSKQNENSTDSSAAGLSDVESSGSADEVISSKDTLVNVSAYTDPGNFNSWAQATAQASVVSNVVLEPLVRFKDGQIYSVAGREL